VTEIANRWTGNGVPDGEAVTTGNVNATGNGANVTRNASGTPTFLYAGDGFSVVTSGAADLARIDATVSGTAVRAQVKLTVGATPSAQQDVIQVRNASATVAAPLVATDRTIQIHDVGANIVASKTPVVAVGDVVLIDVVAALSSTATTSNGRLFYRVRNLTNEAWNSGVPFFYDSGYTRDLGTAVFTAVRFGKMATGLLADPGFTFEAPGWEVITVNPADTSAGAAAAYFADPPPIVVQLATPVVTLVSKTDATVNGASNGTAVISWPTVPNAGSYTVDLAPGAGASSGFVTQSTSATSPFTVTGLSAGEYTVGVTALP